MKKYLCIDCGGTYFKYAVIGENQEIFSRGKVDAICNDLGLFLECIREFYLQDPEVAGIAMSMPGVIEVESGFMRTGGSIKCVYGILLAQRVSEMCGGLPVTVENDAKAAATAELYAGVLAECQSGVVIVVGTGLGGTVIIDRKIIRGANLFSGEISFSYFDNRNMIDINGIDVGDTERLASILHCKRCTPGRICCLYGQYTGKRVKPTDTPMVFAQARAGDEAALRAIRACCNDLAMLIFNIQCVIDPEVVAIGGGISNDPLYLELLRQEMKKYVELHFAGPPMPRLEVCKFKSDANLFGALFFHLDRMGQVKVQNS